MAVGGSNSLIGNGRPGGPGGNKYLSKNGDRNPIRKARPDSALGAAQSKGTKGNQDDATRKARPKSSGSGQSTAHK